MAAVVLPDRAPARSRAKRDRALRDDQSPASSIPATAARRSAGSDRASGSPSPRTPPAGSSLRICSTTLTRSKNSGQSIDDSSRMLVITLPMASWSVASRWCSSAEQLFGRIALRLERALQRLPGRRRRRRLVAQPLQQLDDERRGQPAVGLDFRAAAADRDPSSRLAPALAERRFPLPRLLAAVPRGDDAVDEAPQLLDQPEAQHDRNRPGLADRQRRDALIGGGEIDQRFEIEPPRGVRDELARDQIDARVARRYGPSAPASAARGRTSAADPGGPRGPDPGRRGSCRAASPPRRPAADRCARSSTGIDRPSSSRAALSSSRGSSGRARRGSAESVCVRASASACDSSCSWLNSGGGDTRRLSAAAGSSTDADASAIRWRVGARRELADHHPVIIGSAPSAEVARSALRGHALERHGPGVEIRRRRAPRQPPCVRVPGASASVPRPAHQSMCVSRLSGSANPSSDSICSS